MLKLKNNEVLVVPCSSYDRSEVSKAYETIFEYFYADKISGKTVYIKPNILRGDAPERASVTHPEIVFQRALRRLPKLHHRQKND